MYYDYSEEYQNAAADEYDALAASGKYPKILGMIDDYGITRKSIRICQSK